MNNTPEFDNSAEMSNIICQFYNYKLKGYWHGSSHGYHPRGVIRNGICFSDGWNTNNYSFIYIGESPDVEWTKPEDCPTAFSASADPNPITGNKIQVWGFSKWHTEDENIKKKVIDTFLQLKEELVEAMAKKEKNDERERKQKQEENESFKRNVSSNWK